jgi:hypothetical protein
MFLTCFLLLRGPDVTASFSRSSILRQPRRLSSELGAARLIANVFFVRDHPGISHPAASAGRVTNCGVVALSAKFSGA